MKWYINLIFLINILLSCSTSSNKVEITSRIQIYVDPDEAPAVGTAVSDLQRDLEPVLGGASIIVDKIQESGEVIVVATGEAIQVPCLPLPAGKLTKCMSISNVWCGYARNDLLI